LEGLLAAAQNWPISYQMVLKENSSAYWHSCLEKSNPQLVGILVLKKTTPQLVDVLVEPL
jgi:hypothetical protein